MLLVWTGWTRPEHPAPAPPEYLGWPWRRTAVLRSTQVALLVLALPSFVWLLGIAVAADVHT